MIKPETIRKGSKVFLSDTLKEPVTVLDNINGEILLQAKKVMKVTLSELFPVPLTPDQIVRCGFFKTDDYIYEHPAEKIELEIDPDGVINMNVHEQKITISMQAVHELQHAFWTYTAKELDYR